ncbi:hypothetical protein [Xylophilus sp. ASV27]|uniref:hypothetical protein n=1 Tax=Xylophilus sp. ASV27 TaxID=2795129 RepID=UPI0018EC9258|nr:hypothetical protein [Xylophilus sp. ASV27]
MKLSPYFRDLRSAYQAELEDLSFDSEDKNVLRQRLTQKRNEMAFLVQMMELSPEMVAVVFHQGFRFTGPSRMEHLLGLHAGQLPAWDSLKDSIQLEPWAQGLAQTVLREPGGSSFMTLAAVLEYLYHHVRPAPAPAQEEADAEEDGDDTSADDDFSRFDADDARDPQDRRTREEAGADWLADQGFDRKD